MHQGGCDTWWTKNKIKKEECCLASSSCIKEDAVIGVGGGGVGVDRHDL